MSIEIINSDLFKTSTLKAYYRFNTGALTTDSSGNSHTLTAISDPAEIAGMFGMAADFDGNDAYSATDHADFKPSTSFSVSCWIRPSSLTGDTAIFSSYYNITNPQGIWFGTSSGYLFMRLGNNTASYLDTYVNILSINNIYHAVGTYDGDKARLYLNGSLVQTSASWGQTLSYNASNNVRICCKQETSTNLNFFTGWVDDLAFWNGKVLTDVDAGQIFYGTPAGFKNLLGVGR